MTEEGTLRIAGLEAAPGKRVTQELDVPVGDQMVTIPLILVNGARPGPRVAVTGGIHGAEYVGIEAARRLGMELDPEQVAGSVVVVPISNTTAFHRRSVYTSGLDDNNLNRMFPGRRDGAPAEILAAWLFENIIRPSQFYVDLHGGDMIEALAPFVIYLRSDDPEVEQRSREMAIATGIERVIRSETPGSTYGAATAAGIPSILAEIGGQGIWSEEDAERHREGARRVLRLLGILAGEQPTPGDFHQYDTFAWLRSEAGGLFYPQVAVGEYVEQGQLVGWVTDYFGNELQRVQAPVAGEVIFLVTALAINQQDPLLAIGA